MGKIQRNIYAITVSKNYSNVLAVSLDYNLKFFTKWFIATQDDDFETINLIKSKNDSRLELVLYPLDPRKSTSSCTTSLLKTQDDLKISTPTYLEPTNGTERNRNQANEYHNLTKDGVTFDKGGALRQIQKFLLPKYNLTSNDLVLMIDSDIAIPDELSEHINKLKIKKEEIYVCSRKNYIFYSDFEKECGVLDKNSLVGAGYFQLYQYDSSKLCKRTYTAGWVDWEFKEQFKYLKQIKNMSVSHLGETDMNWSGKKCETFLYDHDIKNYCNDNELHYSDNIYENKRTIINSIRVNRMNSLTRKKGLPTYLLMGNVHSGVKEMQSALSKSHNISFFQQSWPNLSFFGNNYIKNEMWQKHMHFYLDSFPKITNHDWFDSIEFDLSNKSLFQITKSRLKIVFTEKIKIWKEFQRPKIIFCFKNPIIRALKHYQFYCDNFPASINWNWKKPSKSFASNVTDEHGALDFNSTFMLNNEYCKLVDWILQDLRIPLKNILFIDTDAHDKILMSKVSSFMQCNLNNISKFESQVDPHIMKLLDPDEKARMQKYFREHNTTLKKFTGIDYNG